VNVYLKTTRKGSFQVLTTSVAGSFVGVFQDLFGLWAFFLSAALKTALLALSSIPECSEVNSFSLDSY